MFQRLDQVCGMLGCYGSVEHCLFLQILDDIWDNYKKQFFRPTSTTTSKCGPKRFMVLESLSDKNQVEKLKKNMKFW